MFCPGGQFPAEPGEADFDSGQGHADYLDSASGAMRPVVAVWTPDQLSAFLSSAARHPLFAAFRLMGMRGLRRGEACGLQWGAPDLDEGIAYIAAAASGSARVRQATTDQASASFLICSRVAVMLRSNSRIRARAG